MEITTDNLTFNITGNSTLSEVHEFGYYSFFITALFFIPATVVNFFLVGSVIREKAIPSAFRLILVNIVLALQLSIVGLLKIFLANVVYDIFHFAGTFIEASTLGCRFMLFTLSVGGSSRLLFMATLAVTVYIIVKKGKKYLALWKTALISTGVWIFSTAISWIVFSPNVVRVTIIGASTCSYHGTGIGAKVGSISYLVVYGVSSFILTIMFSAMTHVYLRNNTLTEDRKGLRRLALFTLCLLVGNVFNSLGQSIPLIIGAFSISYSSQEEFDEQAKIQTLVEGIIFFISIVPTPILILIYFQNISLRFFCLFVRIHRLYLQQTKVECRHAVKSSKQVMKDQDPENIQSP